MTNRVYQSLQNGVFVVIFSPFRSIFCFIFYKNQKEIKTHTNTLDFLQQFFQAVAGRLSEYRQLLVVCRQFLSCTMTSITLNMLGFQTGCPILVVLLNTDSTDFLVINCTVADSKLEPTVLYSDQWAENM